MENYCSHLLFAVCIYNFRVLILKLGQISDMGIVKCSSWTWHIDLETWAKWATSRLKINALATCVTQNKLTFHSTFQSYFCNAKKRTEEFHAVAFSLAERSLPLQPVAFVVSLHVEWVLSYFFDSSLISNVHLSCYFYLVIYLFLKQFKSARVSFWCPRVCLDNVYSSTGFAISRGNRI